MNPTNFTISDDQKSLTVERQFTASQDKVWEAYTTAEQLNQWFAPVGWECTTQEFSFTDGGSWMYTFKCIDPEQKDFYGMSMSGKLIYDSIHPKDSFGYIDAFLDENGKVNEDMPSSHTKLTLKENNEGTLLSFVTTYPTAEALKQVVEMGMREGLDESFTKLENLLG